MSYPYFVWPTSLKQGELIDRMVYFLVLATSQTSMLSHILQRKFTKIPRSDQTRHTCSGFSSKDVWILNLNSTTVTRVRDHEWRGVVVSRSKQTKYSTFVNSFCLCAGRIKKSDNAKNLSTIFIYRQRSLIAGLEFTHL